MRRLGIVVLPVIAGTLVAGAGKPEDKAAAPAQKAPVAPAPDPAVSGVAGAYAFRTYCASCHGTDGRGDGPLAENLRFHPPDLTLIARKNGGGYPAEKVHRIVDGRRPLPGHGGPDMPIWGDAFRNAETGYDDAKVKEKIRSVVDFVRTLQAR
ncbi:MAG TPA: c-type cytochrome [Vicinamibacteria bacterium]